MASKKSSTEIIRSVARSLGYTTKYLSSEGVPKRLLIANGKKVCIVNSSKFGFYPEIKRWQQHLFDSKLHTQEVLKYLGYKTIPTIEIKYKSHTSFASLRRFLTAKVKKFPVILKPENGFKGRDIDIIDSHSQLYTQAKQLYKKKKDALIQPILNYDEYRILVVNNEVEVVHTKAHRHIISDGVTPLKKLLADKNEREKDALFIKQQLKARALTLNSVLKAGATFPYHLTKVSSPKDFYATKNIPKSVSVWATELAKAISSPTVGIDVFAPAGINDPSKYIVIELNANPAFDYFGTRYNDPETTIHIIKKTLIHYFKES